MSDRTINFGESETEATYQIQDTDTTGGGNFVVAKDTNANTVLLQYDPGTDTWEYAADVDMNGGNVSGVGTLTADSVNTEQADITNATILQTSTGYETVEGTDPDDRLDNALSKATEGDAIYLENAEYSKERTGTDSIDVRVALYGVSQESGANNSTHHTADWTVTEIHQIKHVGGDATLRVEADRINISELTHTGDIEIVDDNCMLFAINAATVTFEDGTSGNVIDASADVSVIDNGDNTVGDVT